MLRDQVLLVLQMTIAQDIPRLDDCGLMIRFVKALLFALLTVVMTWPQAARLTTDAWPHEDVFFNMWRLGWFAHALAKSPATCLDGNIFYPESRTLTYSDAMVVESEHCGSVVC